ncbi:PBSX family phage terminase large subunit [Ligilactobacillus ruminis]|uniref:Phage terminase, large subunit, PBSX family n=1 Tax=Ligilactobacillus ruminis ATCC 25644 TaxID=525362 RepID=E7FPA6_9LACO|nr:PBSX family phage terminase large subunit [Ligilactobacillus ruminis]EFZ35148.1 phage terminase, large subunit, PBSX family [Ligilactobacillus ruminis ATCC 25644]EGX97958.1 phage terminase large subunit [Ligilactobacillus ruminis ATCC 25644]UWP41080.1 PBSX family phage terminase large subunit [Ligilactobacillus ruminis]
MTTVNLNFPKPAKVFNKQIYDNLFDYDHFIEVWYGGASSGKSHGVVQKVVLKACRKWPYPRKILWLRKVDRTIKDSIFADVLDCLSTWRLLPLCKVNKSDRTINLPNGAVFLFKGMDDPEKIKSIKGLSDVVMEEASEFTLDDYTQLTLRLREPKHRQRQLFCMFNPVSKVNWTYKQWFAPDAEYDPSRVAVHHSTYKDNRFLDADNIATIENLKITNPAYYKIYTLGEFATLDKLVFPTFEKRRLRADSLNKFPSLFGLDFGYTNDPSVFIHVKADVKSKVLYVLEEYVKKGMLNDEIAQAIKSLGYAKEKITADAAEKKSIAEIKRNGIYRIRPAEKGPNSVVQGVNFLKEFKIVVDDRCVKTIEELENYTYKKDKATNEYTNEPVDSYNHCIDAIRYAVEEINGKGTVKGVISRNRLF